MHLVELDSMGEKTHLNDCTFVANKIDHNLIFFMHISNQGRNDARSLVIRDIAIKKNVAFCVQNVPLTVTWILLVVVVYWFPKQINNLDKSLAYLRRYSGLLEEYPYKATWKNAYKCVNLSLRIFNKPKTINLISFISKHCIIQYESFNHFLVLNSTLKWTTVF